MKILQGVSKKTVIKEFLFWLDVSQAFGHYQTRLYIQNKARECSFKNYPPLILWCLACATHGGVRMHHTNAIGNQ